MPLQTKEKPLVTVYIPTHNRVELLQRAARSVLDQDYDPIELIIVDDSSTDGTPEYLKHLERLDPRVIALRNSENKGACHSRNRAIQSARGVFVTGLDDDDYFLASRISNFVEAWKKKDSRTIALYSNQYLIEENNSRRVTRRRKFVRRGDLLDRNEVGNQVFTKPETILNAGGFDENVQAWQDYELWFRLLRDKYAKMERVDAIDYVIDMSHPHERITSSGLVKPFQTLQIIARKNSLSRKEYEALKILCCNCAMIAPPFSSLIRKLLFRPNLTNAEVVIKIFLKSLLYRWPTWRSGVAPEQAWFPESK